MPNPLSNAFKITALIALLAGVVFSFSSVEGRSLPDFSKLVEQNQAAVVNIFATQQIKRRPFDPLEDYLRRFMPRGREDRRGDRSPLPRPKSQSLGSGFILSKDGYVLTNAHVVRDASKVFVRLSDRRKLVAEIIGVDQRSDVALLKINASGLSAVKIGSSNDVKVGEWVLAIGSPFGFDYSVTAGIISALRRSLPTENNENYVPFMQTDVAINPGNSGGPLFNLDGEVIGINSQIYTGTGSYIGVSFAIPINIAMEIVEQLKAHGRVARGWLGVTIQEVDAELAESFGLSRPMGALVSRVLRDSPAHQGGVIEGDVIVAVNGDLIEVSGELPHTVGRIKPGTDISVDVVRQSKKMRLYVTLGELSADSSSAVNSKGQSKGSNALRERLGLAVRDLSDADMRRIRSLNFDGGVLVTNVWDGVAADARIFPRDVLLSISGIKILSAAKMQSLIASLRPGQRVSVHIIRGNSILYVSLRIP